MSDQRISEGRIRKTIDNLSGGYNLFLDPTKIKESEFTIFENLITYEKGRFLNASKRRGFERYNTNRTISTNPIRSIYETIWKAKLLAINNRTLVRTSNSLEYCEGPGAYTNIASGLTDVRMNPLTFKDNVYMADGAASNKYYDGTNYLDIGTPPCYQSFTAIQSATSKVNLGTGIYSYLICYLYDGNQESSLVLKQTDPNVNFVIFVGTQLSVLTLQAVQVDNATGKKINLSSIPTGNARVTARIIYRTKNNGNIFYYHSTLSDNTTTVLLNDDISDNELIEEYNGGDGFKNILKPYKSKYHVVHERRIWQANLVEDQYETIDITGITAASNTVSGGIISNNVTRAAKYKYKFAKDIRVMKGKEISGTPALIKPPYRGIFGVMSAAKSITTTPGDTEVYLTVVPIDSWCLRTAVFRNCCQFITGISVSVSTLTITMAAASVFKSGESVTISGVTGFTSNPNGTYIISGVTATTFQITHATVGGAYGANSGVIEGSNYYLCGFTVSGTFTDGYSDAYMVQNHITVETATANKPYRSTVIASEVDMPDIFPAGGEINLGQDNNEEITGIYSIQRRMIVFKEQSIYEIDTTYQDTSFARGRRIVNGIGAYYDSSIIQTSDNLFLFLAADNYFYIWPGGGKPVKISNEIQSEIDSLVFTSVEGCYYPRYNWAVWTYSTADIKGNVLIYDMNEANGGVWYHFKKNDTDLNLSCPYILRSGNLLFGNKSAGYIMQYGTGNKDNLWTSGTTFENKNIRIKLQTKLFDLLQTVKKINARIYSSGVGFADQLEVYYGNEAGAEIPKTLPALAGNLNNTGLNINLTGREFYFRIEHAEDIYISFKNIGFEYLPAHTEGAA